MAIEQPRSITTQALQGGCLLIVGLVGLAIFGPIACQPTSGDPPPQRMIAQAAEQASEPAQFDMATAPRGVVKFCRATGYFDANQKKLDSADIRLPSGVLLDDYGATNDPDWVDHRWPLGIMTLKPVEMRPHVRCVTVPAVILPQSKVRTVAPSDHRDLELTGVGTPDGQDDPNADILPEQSSDIHASVVTEFR